MTIRTFSITFVVLWSSLHAFAQPNQLIPWGIPKHRTVPPNAVMSNTVQLRLDGKAPDGIPLYTPENLAISNRKLSGYPIASVVPYQL